MFRKLLKKSRRRRTAAVYQARVKKTHSNIIFFYIAREILFAFAVCFLFFFFIFFVNQLLLMAREILAKRVPLYQVALLVFYSLPSIIAMASPFACLTGTLMTVGRLASDNEILVLLSSGFSYRDIFFPALAVGLLISLFSFAANDILLPAGTVQFSRLYRRILLSTPALELEADSVKRFKNTVVVTGPAEGGYIRDILILDKTGEGERRLILASGARLEDSEKGKIVIDLENAFIRAGKENLKKNYDYASASSLRYYVSREDMLDAIYTPGPREMSSVDVRREIKTKEAALASNLEAGYSRLAGEALELETALREGSSRDAVFPAWEQSRVNLREMKKDRPLAVFRLEYYKKFSIPFGALSFILAAVSIGLMAGKGGQTVGFIIGICTAAVYWSLLLIGQELCFRLSFPPFWCMWFPNILAIAAGVVLTAARIMTR